MRPARRPETTTPVAARVVAVLVACVLSGGCASQEALAVDFTDTPRDYVPKDYERVYDRWTRHQQIFRDEDIALEVWATFKSWDFREAFIERYAEIYSLPDADKTKLREAQKEIVHQAYEFHVTAQATKYAWNDLEKPSSAWRATLVDALGHELAPESIKVIKLPDIYEEAFFPKRTAFTKTYAFRFLPPSDEGVFAGTKSGALTLRIAGPAGRIELEWRH